MKSILRVWDGFLRVCVRERDYVWREAFNTNSPMGLFVLRSGVLPEQIVDGRGPSLIACLHGCPRACLPNCRSFAVVGRAHEIALSLSKVLGCCLTLVAALFLMAVSVLLR